jgi:predicted  nucleic acid-binding Zn-ribbon protein
MSEEKRIPDEIFEELCGFVDNSGNPITNITPEEFEIEYPYNSVNRQRVQLAGEALLSKVFKKFSKALSKNIIQPFLKESLLTLDIEKNKEKLEKEEKENKEKTNFFKKIINAFKKAYDAINSAKKFIQRLNKIFKWLSKKVFKKWLRRLSKIMRKAGRAVEKLKKRINKLISFLKKRIGRAAKTLRGLIRKAIRAIGNAARAIAKNITKAIKALRRFITPIIKRIRFLIKKLKRFLKRFFKPIVKAIRKGLISAGKGLGKAIRKQLLKIGVKSLGKMAAKRAAAAGASIAAGAATSAGIITAPVGAVIAVGGTIINVALFAWDAYGYYTMGKTVVNVLSTLSNMDNEIGDLENLIAAEKAAMAAEEAQINAVSQPEQSLSQPPPPVMNFEETLSNYEYLHSKMNIRDDIAGYDTQMQNLEKSIVNEFERMSVNSAKMRELMETYNNRPLHDLINAFKTHQNEIASEIMSTTNSIQVSSNASEESTSNKMQNTFNNLNEIDTDEEPEGSLIVIWKKIITYIEDNFWSSKKGFWKDFENFIPNEEVELKLVESIRAPKHSSSIEYIKVPNDYPLEISQFNFEQWLENENSETNSEWKIGFKSSHYIKTKTVFSIAKQMMGNVYDEFKSYIFSKENEHSANTNKLTLLKDIKFALLTV